MNTQVDNEKFLMNILEMLVGPFENIDIKYNVYNKNILSELELKDKNDQYDNIINELDKLYSDTGYRHSYSTISRFIINKKNDFLKNDRDNYKNQQIEEALWQNMASKIEMIYNRARNNNYRHLNRLFKLRDHINLEILRLSDSQNMLFTLEDKIKTAEKSLDTLDEKSRNIQKDYIAILGIFAAIVLAFISGLVFSNSVLQNINKSNIFRLGFVIVTIGFFVTSILYFLFNFLEKMTTKTSNINNKHSKHILCFGIFTCILMILLFVATIYYEII